MSKTNDDGQTFGSWLCAQRGQSGAFGRLIDGAKADRTFPRYGTPDEVRRHLLARNAKDDLFQAIDAAEAAWLAA